MKLKRAYSPGEVLNMKIPRFEFSGDWQTSIGNPAKSGVWIIWGASGNGKSSFVMQLAKYLCSFGRVIYDSLEESTGLSFQMSLKRHKMGEVKKKLIILDREPMEQLEERLRRRGSPGIVIIDSFQYSGLNYKTYKEFKERHPKKLFIFISHAEGLHPAGRSARKVEYDADVKIMVSCFKAWCKSRFMGGPVNKVATLFAQTQVDTLPYLMGGVGVAICTPPIGMGIATLLAPKKYNAEEKEAGKAAILMGCVGITEGAIPFAANDPLRVIPSLIVGAVVGNIIPFLTGVLNHAPWGGLIVLPVVEGRIWYIISVLAGGFVTAIMVNLLKKNNTDDMASKAAVEDDGLDEITFDEL